MRKSIRAVIGLLTVCGVAACDSLWGAYYQCKTEKMCDISDGSVDMRNDNAEMASSSIMWELVEFHGEKWVNMSLVPSGADLWLLGPIGQIAFLSSLVSQPEMFNIVSVATVGSGETFRGISACEPMGNSLSAIVLSDHSSYRISNPVGPVNTSPIDANYQPNSYKEVVCKRDQVANNFVYISTSTGTDFVAKNGANFAMVNNGLMGPTIDVMSPVPNLGSSDFWAIDSSRRIIYAEQNKTPAVHPTAAISGSRNIISSIDKNDAFYVDKNGGLVRASTSGMPNPVVDWIPPTGVEIFSIFTIDFNHVWVASSDGYVREINTPTSVNSMLVSTKVPIGSMESLSKIAVAVLPDKRRVVYVLTSKNALYRAMIP